MEPCDSIPAQFDSAGCWTLTVPDRTYAVDVDAVGAAGQASDGAAGLGDEMSATAAGISDDNQLRVCVDYGGGSATSTGDTVILGGDGGGASGVSLGADFAEPFVVAGGGGGGGTYGSAGDRDGSGGNAGQPSGQPGHAGGPTGTGGGGGTDVSGGGGGAGEFGVYGGLDGKDGAGFDADGPGQGGDGGSGYTSGGAGGAGYYGGGGAGGHTANGAGGGGGGSSYCGGDNVSGQLRISDCSRTAGVGTQHSAGSGAGDANVSLAFHIANLCDRGTYSATGDDRDGACTAADAGHYVDASGATDQQACLPGTYQPSTGQELCLRADAGHYVDTTAATDQQPCLPGTYQPSSGQESCLQADIGYYVDTSGATSQTACPAGQTTAAMASDSISDCYTPYVTPYAHKQAALAEIQALLPTGDAAADFKLGKAVARITKSLAVWRWNGEEALSPRFGWKVFNLEKRAVSWLWSAPVRANPNLSAVANDAINELIAADRQLVVKAIAASSDPAAIAKANRRLARADALIAANWRGPAIYKLRAAWLAVR